MNTPSGRPASFHRSPSQIAADGSFSLGFSTTVLPGSDRDREEPHRHHRREVERADDPDDTERLLGRVHVDTGRDLLGVLALQVVREPGRELHDLLPAGDLAQRVGDDLAVLRRDDLGQLPLLRLEQLTEREHDLLTLRERRVAPGGERGLRRRRRRASISAWFASATCFVTTPSAGS